MIRWIFIFAIICTTVILPQQGLVKTYYKDNSVESEINYSNNIRNGEAKFYFENGKLQKTLSYVNGKVDGLVKEYYENGKLKLSYTITNGKKEGPVSFFKEDGSFINDITYEQGKRIFDDSTPVDETTKTETAITSANAADSNTAAANSSNTDSTIKIAEILKENKSTPTPPVVTDVIFSPSYAYSRPDVMPEPKGGLNAISKRVYMSDEAKENQVSGIVKIEAVIDTNGDVIEDKILEDIGYNCGEAARITVLYTKFKPGLLKGIPVKVRMVIPVEFKSPTEKQ